MISAKVIADTIWNGKRITTLQLTMPRFILAQFNTHRAFSRSTASSRAIPVEKQIEMVVDDPVVPSYWGANQAGMQADEQVKDDIQRIARMVWLDARDAAVKYARDLMNLGLHKQLANRILEPYMWAHTVVTATEWENFFYLRLDDAAQPEMRELAGCMHVAMEQSVPAQRDYHLPYITLAERGKFEWECEAGARAYEKLSEISAARCARVSYLNHDQSEPDWNKDVALARKLLQFQHMSPFEHQAECAESPEYHSRNFVGWYQNRDRLGE